MRRAARRWPGDGLKIVPAQAAIADALVRCDGVVIAVAGCALCRPVDFALHPGDRIVVHGPSGCGKTTLLRCLLGFARPAAGSIHIAGRLLEPHGCWQQRLSLAYVPQEIDFGQGLVVDVLRQPFTLRANAGRGDDSVLWALMTELGLDASLLERRIEYLSGGEKQRLGLVIALALERPVLVLDEPSSALDAAARDRVLAALENRPQLAVLSVSHDPHWRLTGQQVCDMQTPIKDPP